MVQRTVDGDAHVQQNMPRRLRLDSGTEVGCVGEAVPEGVAALRGTVGAFAAKGGADDPAHRMPGVPDVVANRVVKEAGVGSQADTALGQTVRRILEWDTLVPGVIVQSTVHKGWVTLFGSVDHTTYRDAAERAVRYLRGVSGVTNNITIRVPAVDPAEIRTAIKRALLRHTSREIPDIGVEVTADTVRLTGRVHSWSENRAVVGAAGHAADLHVVCDELIIDPTA